MQTLGSKVRQWLSDAAAITDAEELHEVMIACFPSDMNRLVRAMCVTHCE